MLDDIKKRSITVERTSDGVRDPDEVLPVLRKKKELLSSIDELKLQIAQLDLDIYSAKGEVAPSELLRVKLLFNEKPEKGLALAVKMSIIGTCARSASRFLFNHRNKGFSKKRIGEFIGGGGEYNSAVRANFTQSHDFSGVAFDVALRGFLTSFRMPGECQIITRIVEDFADVYSQQNGGAWGGGPLACFYLAFSAVMLSTSLHNPNANVPAHTKTLQFFREQVYGTKACDLVPEEVGLDLFVCSCAFQK